MRANNTLKRMITNGSPQHIVSEYVNLLQVRRRSTTRSRGQSGPLARACCCSVPWSILLFVQALDIKHLALHAGTCTPKSYVAASAPPAALPACALLHSLCVSVCLSVCLCLFSST